MKRLTEDDLPFLKKNGGWVFPSIFIILTLCNVGMKIIPGTAMHNAKWITVLLPLIIPSVIYFLIFIYAIVQLIRLRNPDPKRETKL